MNAVWLVNPPERGLAAPLQSRTAAGDKLLDFPPLGLLALAAWLRREVPACTVAVADARLWMAQREGGLLPADAGSDLRAWLGALCGPEAPRVIGIGAPYHTVADEFHALAGLLRAQYPAAVIVAGGPYATGSPERVLADPAVDYLVAGEGEERLTVIVRAVLAGETASGAGISTRAGGAAALLPAGRGIAPERLPLPARDLIDLRAYRGFSSERTRAYATDRRTRAAIYLSRGCPNRCTYCYSGAMNYFGEGIRFLPVDRALAEIDECISRYGADEVQILDENALAHRAWLRELFDRFAARHPDKLLSVISVDLQHADPATVTLLAQRRQRVWFTFGLESGSDRVLRDVLARRQGTAAMAARVDEVRATLAALPHRPEFLLQGSVMFGIPGETRDDMQATIAFCRSLRLDWYGVFCYMPLPGTPLHATCVQRGWLRGGAAAAGRDAAVVSTDAFSAAEATATARHANYLLNFVANPNLDGNPRRALELFDYVLTVVPDHAFARYGLWQAYAKLGETAAARQQHDAYREAVRHEPYASATATLPLAG